jgi:hypothetical protein
MATIDVLQAIGDSDFEVLVAAYLRRADDSLRGLISTGINEDGKPIPCPVDNILYIPGNPPKYVIVHSTTTKKKFLRNKWLGEKGDLQKAIREFSVWQIKDPDIKCILYLATNRLLKSDVPLYRDVINVGKKNRVGIRVIEASTLRDFLDYDADGQYIRSVLLGLDAQRLSKELLYVIAQQSLNQHRWRFALPQSPNSVVEIIRDQHNSLIGQISRASKPLIGLRGASGTGKSTLLRQVGESINSDAGIALWLPAEDISPNLTLSNLLLNLLQRYEPTLETNAIDELFRLVTTFPQGIVLLIDDINRTDSSAHALAGLSALGAEIAASKVPVRMVTSLWPGQLAKLPDEKARQKLWTFVELGNFSKNERARFTKSISAPKHESRVLLDALHGDPFLCGLAICQDMKVCANNSERIIQEVFEQALRASFEAAQEILTEWESQQDFEDALNTLIRLILQKEYPKPLWCDIRDALGEKQAQLLKALAKSNRIGWIDNVQGRDVWRWKHSRLRDGLVGRWLATKIFPSMLEDDLSYEVVSWLSDPGLAEALALAFIFLPSEHASYLKKVGRYQPFVLAEILRLKLFSTETNLRAIITAQLQETLTDYDRAGNSFVDSPHNLLFYTLAQVTDPIVLDITKNMKSEWYISLARFRNGDLDAGVQIISKRFANDFPVHINFPFLEAIIREFALQRETQRENTAAELADKIHDRSSAIVILYIASMMQWPELIDPIWQAWDCLSQDEKKCSVAAMVWFLSIHEVEAIVSKLQVSLLISLELNDKESKKGHASERYDLFIEPLRLTLWRPMSSIAAETWAETITSNNRLRENTTYLLGGIDHPKCLEAYIRWQGKRQWFGYWDETGETIDPLAERPFRHIIPVKSESRQHVWDIIVHDHDKDVRREAFYMWRRSAQVSDLPALREISEDDPLFDTVLKLRLKLRDKAAAPILIQKINQSPEHWCRYAPLLIDEQGIFDALAGNIEQALRSETDLGYSDHLYHHLTHHHLQKLIVKNRAALLHRPRTWPSLWHSSEPKALHLVQEGIRQSSPDDIKHFFLHSTEKTITLAMLETIEPILHLFSEDNLRSLGWALVRQKKIDWLQEHLAHIIKDKNSRVFAWLTCEDIVSTFDKAAELVPSGWKVVDRESHLRSLEISIEHGRDYIADIIEATKIWLKQRATANRLIIAARVVSKFGNAADIGWWANQDIKGDREAHEMWHRAMYHLKRRRWQE